MPIFKSMRFGELEYNQEDVIKLPEGLIGMPGLQNWLILEMDQGVPLNWFQSLDRGDFGFPLSQPLFYRDDYELEVPAAVRQNLEIVTQEEAAVLIITTVHPGGKLITGNLLAPLVLNTRTRLGAQLTLDDQRYGMRQEINYFKFGLAVKSDSADNEAAENREPVPAADSGGQIQTPSQPEKDTLEPANM